LASPPLGAAQLRYAVYFAPAQGSLLWDLGCAWLGRDAATGAALAQPAVPGLSYERVQALTASARHYGLHATLKPPFFPAAGVNQQSVLDALHELAGKCRPFELPRLRVSMLSDFIALRTTTPSAELDELAQRCVAELDYLRRAPDAEELERRRAQCLSARQETLLRCYGYPYVMDEWRFHITLTERVFDDERDAALRGLEHHLGPALQAPVYCEDVCLFVQTSPHTPFMLERRVPLGGR
jgi:putative phosphonate metabolism protein